MGDSQPLVSVIIPCFNHDRFVRESIESIINQDYSNIELIVIDDGSSDSSVSVIKEMSNVCASRFKRFEFRSRGNKGLCETLNEALVWCEGEFLAPIASDDIMLPHKTASQVGYLLENKNCVAVFGGARIIRENSEIDVDRPAKNKRYFFEDIILNRYSLFTCSQLVRAAAVRAVGGYAKNLAIEDWYMNLKLTEFGYSLDSVAGVCVCYRRHSNNTSNDIALMHKERLKVLSLFQHSRFYSCALNEYTYTRSKEIVPYSKSKALGFLWAAFVNDPIVVFRLGTIILLVKVLLPKRYLMARKSGVAC